MTTTKCIFRLGRHQIQSVELPVEIVLARTLKNPPRHDNNDALIVIAGSETATTTATTTTSDSDNDKLPLITNRRARPNCVYNAPGAPKSRHVSHIDTDTDTDMDEFSHLAV